MLGLYPAVHVGKYQCMVLVLTCLITITIQAVTPKREELKFIYPRQVRSERGLSVCVDNEVCSVVHQRFWIRSVIERLCRCRTGQQCPYTWSHQNDNQSMALSNRSQMKFCDNNLGELPECLPEDQAILISGRNETERKVGHKNKTETAPGESVTVHCRCGDRNYWQFHKYETKNDTSAESKIYRCSKVQKCAPMEFCGHVRSDYYSTYYRCSCPVGHMCLFQSRATLNITELFYHGPAYRAICYPNFK